MSSNRNARHRAREYALQGVYQWLLSGHGLSQIEQHVAESSAFDKADRELFISLLRGTITNAEALQETFGPFVERPLAELSPIEKAVLLIATHELRHNLEVPYRVVINEAIELTKAYGGTEGHRFVNGVLDKLAARLRPDEVDARRPQAPQA